MRANIWLIFALAGLSCAAPTLQDQRMMSPESRLTALGEGGPPSRVFLITIAGLESGDFLNARGHIAGEPDEVSMPNLARLAREGSIGIQVRPPIPSSTYASHATLATGLRPIRHGIMADAALDETGSRSLPFSDNRLLKGTALWDAAIGRGVLGLGWPTTHGARIELIVAGGGSSDVSGGWLESIRIQSSPMLMRKLDAIAEAALEDAERPKDDGDIPVAWPTAAEKDSAFAELACQIVASERDPGLWMIRFDQTAGNQRFFGYGSVEVDEALGRIDVEIGRIVACLDAADQLGETAIFVSGDVRYRPVHTRVDPNVVLARAGLIGRDPRSSTGVRSWLAIVRSNGRSAYVYARDEKSALASRELLEDEAIRTRGFEVVSAADLARAGGDPQAWFGLAARPGFVIGQGLVQPAMRTSELRASAGAFPFIDPEAASVGLVAWGRGVRSRVRVPSFDLTDVAPTISTLLGLRLEDKLDGEPILGLLRAVAPLPPPGPKRLGVDGDRDIDRTLRELGGNRAKERGE